ncbi:MAG: hypothetical protein IJF21_09195, partial [Clostridia bacterium]|nr:hypothetical protein [Clostridia bacterium]
MYPFEIFFGIDLYTCFVALGIILALLVFRIFSKYIDISTRLYNFTMINGAVSIAFGFFSAVFFQSLYNIKQQNGFVFGSGATFMGGLAGGALLFLAVYFIIGRIIFKDGENLSKLSKIADLGVCSISIAHACGR